jgi:hypothetical protein
MIVAIALQKYEDNSRFWLQLAQADIIGVRQFAQQFILVGGDESERGAQSLEWLSLCQLTNSAVNQERIRNNFDTFVLLIHRLQKLNIDPTLAGTNMLEGLFSTQMRKYDPTKTNARFDDVIFFRLTCSCSAATKGKNYRGAGVHKVQSEAEFSRC